MTRSANDLLQDARGIAERTSTRLVLIGGGLLLIWSVTFEAGADFIYGEQRKLLMSSVRAIKLERRAIDLRAKRTGVNSRIAEARELLETLCRQSQQSQNCSKAKDKFESLGRKQVMVAKEIGIYDSA